MKWVDVSGLVKTAKEGGIDVIETYVFQNGHELSPSNVILLWGVVRSSQVCEDCSAAGMYLILHIGPFVATEWNFGCVDNINILYFYIKNNGGKEKIKMLCYDIMGFLFGCITCLELSSKPIVNPSRYVNGNVDVWFLYHMQKFMTLIVNIMKKDKLLHLKSPIILTQASITLNMKLVWWKMCG
ncbi:Beta-galactosidase 10 [Vitis vinifera]|uniref:beta-galactosidase n=1 Tax=Vitis vinifera TaxID=29760 RepID=A0A438CF38_VITVI|nr:Beta-galactosidase 10 [Vitis vinifera]